MVEGPPFLGVIRISDIFEIKSFRPSALPVSFKMLPSFFLGQQLGQEPHVAERRAR
jgi:hypothetical protein